MLDYVTKMMLLEIVKATIDRDIFAVSWIEKNMSELYNRWSELDGT